MKTVKEIPLKDIETDPIGDMLSASASMKPYIDHYCAVMTFGDQEATLQAIAALPVEQRYVTRIAQCLDWALADFDGETVQLDMPYLPDLDRVKAKLRLRAYQLLHLLNVLEGKE